MRIKSGDMISRFLDPSSWIPGFPVPGSPVLGSSDLCLGEAKMAEIEGRLVGMKHACFLRGLHGS